MAPDAQQAVAVASPSAGHPMVPRPFRVVQYRRELRDTFTLTLEPLSGPAEFHFQPGQFNMLYQLGAGEVPISISGDPAQPHRLTHTIRAVGNVTGVIQRCRPGDVIGVRGPFGVPWPLADLVGKDVIILTGGLGLAPLRPVIYHVLAHRRDFGKVEIIYGARSPRDLLYRRELERWRGRFDVRVHVTVDTAGPDWHGHVGVVTTLIGHTRFDPFEAAALLCGPGVMMHFAVQELLKVGLSPRDIYLSLERNMQCGLGLCGHCQIGPFFVCKDGPVFSYERIGPWLATRDL